MRYWHLLVLEEDNNMAFKPVARSVLLDKVAALVTDKFPKKIAPLVNTFVTQLYSGITDYDLHHRSHGDVYGAAINLWQAFATRTDASPYVRVYNPELARHGWQSPHTLVEVICTDAPFLVDSVRMVLSRMGITAHLMLHQPLQVQRDLEGELHVIQPREQANPGQMLETAFLIEIDRQADNDTREALQVELLSVVEEVQLVVADWQPMAERLAAVVAELPAQVSGAHTDEDSAQVNETLAFLNWWPSINLPLWAIVVIACKARATTNSYCLSWTAA